MKKMAKKHGAHLNTKTQKTKTELLRKLKKLAEKYPEDNLRSLDNWDQKGFPQRLEVDICGLPSIDYYARKRKNGEDHYESDTYRDAKEKSIERRNRILQQKYGFSIDPNDEGLYYNADLRSFSGQLFEDTGNCVKLSVHTTRTGISPVGSDAKKVRRLIKDAADIKPGWER